MAGYISIPGIQVSGWLAPNYLHMNSALTSFLLVCLLIPVSCNEKIEDKPVYPVYTTFSSYAHFRKTILTLSSIKGSEERNLLLSDFIDSLKQHGQIPFIMNDSVAFLYNGQAASVSWPGDFNGWSPTAQGFPGEESRTGQYVAM